MNQLELEDRLRTTFAGRGAAVPHQVTSVRSLADGARRLRRRRAAGGVAVAAVVAAVAVPLVVLGPPGGGSSVVATPPAAQAASPSPPRIGYAVGGVYHAPGGREVTLPDGAVDAVVDAGDLFVVSDTGVTQLDEQGRRLRGWCGTSAPVLDWRGLPTWTERPCDDLGDGPATVFGPGPLGGPAQQDAGPAPLLLGWNGGELRFVDTETGRLEATDLRSPARPLQEPPGELTTFAPASGWVGVLLDQDSYTGGVAGADGSLLWEREGVVPQEFNPDGRLLLAVTDSGTVVLDAATGDAIAAVPDSGPDDEPATATVVWEDDDHLLATVTRADGQFLVRYDVPSMATTTLERLDGRYDDVVWASSHF